MEGKGVLALNIVVLGGNYWDPRSLSQEPGCLREARQRGGSGGYQEDLIGLVPHESPFRIPIVSIVVGGRGSLQHQFSPAPPPQPKVLFR